MSRTPKSGRARIAVDTGYDVHFLTCAARTWMRIQRGKELVLRGPGFPVEDHVEQDYWAFNTREPGSVWVFTVEGFEVFLGNIADGEVSVVELPGPS